MNHLPLFLAAALALPVAHAASIIETFSASPAAAIPDGNPSGLASTQTVATTITQIENISVTLNVSGTYNGDLYLYLQHDTGFAVLLNRVGRTSANLFGSSDDGFVVTLNDLGALADIHNANSGGGALTGNFASDGRNVDPNAVLDTSPRSALLNSFVGLDANGGWTLFVADLSGGDTHTLNSWSMEITGVPEPGTLSLLALSAATLLRRRRK
jgi:subtilisin-like proprotein convertase family protein